MTGIDSDTSQDIAEAISLKGGRYLEAQIQGSKSQAQDGTLVILVAGDRSLFDDCQSCFQVNKYIQHELHILWHTLCRLWGKTASTWERWVMLPR